MAAIKQNTAPIPLLFINTPSVEMFCESQPTVHLISDRDLIIAQKVEISNKQGVRPRVPLLA